MQLPAGVVLVPIDFSEASLEALDAARPLVGPPDGLHVIHVLPGITTTDPGVIWGNVSDESRIAHASEALEHAVRSRDVPGANVHVRIAGSGNPAWEIVKLAQQIQADLIVLPSHGRHGLSRIAIGSVAERVVRYASCPVLVLRS